jgi:hypothetical protein
MTFGAKSSYGRSSAEHHRSTKRSERCSNTVRNLSRLLMASVKRRQTGKRKPIISGPLIYSWLKSIFVRAAGQDRQPISRGPYLVDCISNHSNRLRQLSRKQLILPSQRGLYRRMVSSGLLRRVALVRTDVSEEPGASFIRVTKNRWTRNNASCN